MSIIIVAGVKGRLGILGLNKTYYTYIHRDQSDHLSAYLCTSIVCSIVLVFKNHRPEH